MEIMQSSYISMSSAESESLEEGEANSLTANHTQELSQIQIKQELISTLSFLFKIVQPASLAVIPQDFMQNPIAFQLQSCWKLTETVMELTARGYPYRYFFMKLANGAQPDQQVIVSLLKNFSGKDVLGKLMACEESGVYVSPAEAGLLFKLIVGGLRDCSAEDIRSSWKTLRRKTKYKLKSSVQAHKQANEFITARIHAQSECERLTEELSAYHQQIDSLHTQITSAREHYEQQLDTNKKHHESLLLARAKLKSIIHQQEGRLDLQLRPSKFPEDQLE